MKNNKKILNEEIQNLLFHFTSLRNIYNILKNNTIDFSLTLGRKADQIEKKYLFFLSTTRTKSGKVGFARTKDVRIALKKDALKNNFKIKPVDYWGIEFRKIDPISTDETEDRVLATKDSIDNVSNFIEYIDIYVNTGWKYALLYAFMSKLLAEEKGIEINFYTDENSFRNKNKNKVIDLDSEFKAPTEEELIPITKTDAYDFDNDSYIKLIYLLNIIDLDLDVLPYLKIYNQLRISRYHLIIEDYKKTVQENPNDIQAQELLISLIKEKNEISTQEAYDNIKNKYDYDFKYSVLNDIKYAYSYNFSSQVSQYENVIGNLRTNRNKHIRSIIKDIIRTMKKKKFNNISDIILNARDSMQ
jgi:hypothetical protein